MVLSFIDLYPWTTPETCLQRHQLNTVALVHRLLSCCVRALIMSSHCYDDTVVLDNTASRISCTGALMPVIFDKSIHHCKLVRWGIK